MDQPYTVLRSDRKTMTIEVTPGLEIIVRAPHRLARREIERFVNAHTAWIDEHLEKQRMRAEAHPEPNESEIAALQRQARAYLPSCVKHFASLMGVLPTGIRITSAKTRYGSCSGQNSLCFSYRLMLFPREAIEYVVVHELAHITHKNHGKEFYQLIERYMPDYRARRALLRQ